MFLRAPDGTRLFFEAVGTGPATVVVPNGIPLVDDFRALAQDRRLVFFDVRNRGRSDLVTDEAVLARGIENDADDIDAVRRHFGLERIDVIAHSYQSIAAVMYALRFPEHVNRIVLIGPVPPRADKQYPPSDPEDRTLEDVMSRLQRWNSKGRPADRVEACRQFWSILRPIYTVDPADADRVDWGRCDLENERNALGYLRDRVFPSINALALTPERLAAISRPVLIVHGRKDRSAPFAGAEEWATLLPNARFVPVEAAAHVPWIENPALVFGEIDDFLDRVY